MGWFDKAAKGKIMFCFFWGGYFHLLESLRLSILVKVPKGAQRISWAPDWVHINDSGQTASRIPEQSYGYSICFVCVVFPCWFQKGIYLCWIYIRIHLYVFVLFQRANKNRSQEDNSGFLGHLIGYKSMLPARWFHGFQNEVVDLPFPLYVLYFSLLVSKGCQKTVY